jgi:hypothetical protein
VGASSQQPLGLIAHLAFSGSAMGAVPRGQMIGVEGIGIGARLQQ